VSERLLTTREVAAAVALSPETILRRYRSGELRGVRLSSNVLRFRPEDVQAWLCSGDLLPGLHTKARRDLRSRLLVCGAFGGDAVAGK
jgi:excisionase family DNA binding protein